MSIIQRTFDEEMKALVKEYQDKKVTGDKGSELVMRKIRLKHPIFSLITISAFKYLIENGFLFKLKEGQTVYREKQIARANVYFVLYGQFNFTSQVLKQKEDNQFGEIIGLGWTIGEEILYGSRVDQKSLQRHENCVSLNDSCLLQISIDDLITMSTQKATIGGGGMLVKDYETLLSFL